MAIFSFDFEVMVTLNTDEIWVDGDGPENPTLEDVKRELEKECREVVLDGDRLEIKNSDAALRIVQDWTLHDGTYLVVRKLRPLPKVDDAQYQLALEKLREGK